MTQEEILRLVVELRKERKIKREDFDEKVGTKATYGQALAVLNGANGTMGISYVMKLLDALDLQLVVEDKDANWGSDMERLRIMPKQLFLAERLEARELVKYGGFYPRVDLFDNVETCLKFMPKPCEVYSIKTGKLIRKQFEVIHHPFGTMYSYHEHIPADAIIDRVTYR
jgi:hypothetical protein